MIGIPYHLTYASLDAVHVTSTGGSRTPYRCRFHIRTGLSEAAPATDEHTSPDWQRLGGTIRNNRIRPADDTAILDWITGETPLPESSFLCVSHDDDRGVIRRHSRKDTRYHRIQVQAAHNLPFVPAGHRCHRVHGHNYSLTLYATTDQDDLTGMAATLQRKFDRSYLNDIPGLDNPTCEILALWIWKNAQTASLRLSGVAVQETLSSGCYYDGDFHIWRDMRFESAWRVPAGGEKQPGRRYRGGRLLLRVYVTLPLCPEKGWTVDFGEIRKRLAPLRRELDHRTLSDIPALADDTETILFPWLCERLTRLLPDIARVELRQSPTTGRMATGGPSVPPVPV